MFGSGVTQDERARQRKATWWIAVRRGHEAMMKRSGGKNYRSRSKYKRFSLHRGGQWARSVARDPELEAWADKQMHTAHIAIVDPRGHTPSESFAAIARGIQKPWRAECRRILEAVLCDADEAKLSEIPFQYLRYIQRCYELKRRGLLKVRVVNGTTPASPAAMPKPVLVTGDFEKAA